MKKSPDPGRQTMRRFRQPRLLVLLLAAFAFFPTEILAQPLTLEQCLKIALSENPEIARAGYARDEARLNEQAAKAGHFPELALETSAGYRSEVNSTRQETITIPTGPATPPLTIPGRETEIGDNTTADLAVALRQPLYTGGAVSAGVDAARAGLEGATLQVQMEQRDTRRRVISAFYDLAVAEEMEKIARASVARITGHLEDAQNMLEQGLILKSDLLPIRMRRLDSDLAVVEAENAVARAGAALARNMGTDPAAGIDIMVDWGNPPPWPIPSSLSVPRARKEQQIVSRQIEAADARARAARGARLPQVGLTASAHYGWPGFVGNDPDWDTWWQAGVSASWTIFDMDRRRSQEQAALVQKRQLDKTGESLTDRIAQERIVARLAYEESCRRQQIMVEKVETARENYQTKKDHFQVGIATSTDYLDAHTDLLSAEFDLAAAKARVRVAWTDYLTAMGLDEARR